MDRGSARIAIDVEEAGPQTPGGRTNAARGHSGCRPTAVVAVQANRGREGRELGDEPIVQLGEQPPVQLQHFIPTAALRLRESSQDPRYARLLRFTDTVPLLDQP